MDRAAVLGLMLGVLIGSVYALLQRHAMRRGPSHASGAAMLLWAILRMTGLLASIFLVITLTEADRRWLIVSVMATYGIVFLLSMKGWILKRK